MTTPIKGLLMGAFCLSLLPIAWTSPAYAKQDKATETVLIGKAEEAAVQAQGRRAKRRNNGGLLDDIGLGSLDEIPWDAFGLGMVLSALVGAAGGFIYAGIAEPREEAEP